MFRMDFSFLEIPKILEISFKIQGFQCESWCQLSILMNLGNNS